ncbi:MAG: hypothetical protein E7497_06710 [Ruminococcus sp.]|nr:hypothetical protein [Ruminococcus sp.]
MKQEEFRNIFNDIKYTEEFKAKMRRMLSEEPEKAEYSQSVEGVEIDRRSHIVRTSATIAACAAVAIALGVVGYNMRGMFSEEEVTLSSPTEQSTEDETTEAETSETKRKTLFTPYTDLYGKSDDELLEIGRIYYEEAISRYNLNQGSCEWTDLFELDYEKFIESVDYNAYFLIKDENIKTIADINEVYYSVFTDSWEFDKNYFIEHEDGLYFYEPLVDEKMDAKYICYNGYDISFEEATEEIIRYTVTAKFNDGVNYETIVAEVPLEFSLVPTDEGWKVSSFIYAREAPYDPSAFAEAEEKRQQLEELEAEKQEQEAAEAERQIHEAQRKEQEEAAKEALLNATEADPYAWAKEYIGEWRSNYGIDGYKLMIYSVEADIMKFRIVAPDGTSIGVVEGVLGDPVAAQKMVSFGMASDAGDALQGNLYLGDNAVYISIFSDPTSILPTELNFPIHAE